MVRYMFLYGPLTDQASGNILKVDSMETGGQISLYDGQAINVLAMSSF